MKVILFINFDNNIINLVWFSILLELMQLPNFVEHLDAYNIWGKNMDNTDFFSFWWFKENHRNVTQKRLIWNTFITFNNSVCSEQQKTMTRLTSYPPNKTYVQNDFHVGQWYWYFLGLPKLSSRKKKGM